MAGPCMPSFPFKKRAAEEPEPPASDIESELERVIESRRYHFELDCQLPYPLALDLAMAGVDWHAVKRVMDQGMTIEQVEAVFL